MRGLKVTLVALVVLLAALVGFGCGNDDNSSGSALTKAEFIKQADRLCKKGDAQIEVEAEEFAEENKIEEATEAQPEKLVSEVVAPAIQTQAEEIADLGAPEGDEETIEAMVEAVESGAAELEANPLAGMEGKSPLGEASKIARAYGLKECASEE
jgi:phosphosulfolactate synthase (CoM biosynthesis protein A)